jgi:hypothetical protein
MSGGKPLVTTIVLLQAFYPYFLAGTAISASSCSAQSQTNGSSPSWPSSDRGDQRSFTAERVWIIRCQSPRFHRLEVLAHLRTTTTSRCACRCSSPQRRRRSALRRPEMGGSWTACSAATTITRSTALLAWAAVAGSVARDEPADAGRARDTDRVVSRGVALPAIRNGSLPACHHRSRPKARSRCLAVTSRGGLVIDPGRQPLYQRRGISDYRHGDRCAIPTGLLR